MPASRLQRLEDFVKELSLQDDPDRLIRVYARNSDLTLPQDGLVTLTNRGLEPPHYRIMRSWRWHHVINPWTEAHLLPVFSSGLLGELLYRGKPMLINRLQVPPNDPTHEHLLGMGSLLCAPGYDQGRPLYLAVALRRQTEAFTLDELETLLLNVNFLVRAASNLMLTQQLREAYQQLDMEMHQVGRMQRLLLPAELPHIDGLELAASYVTSSRAGGDYYDLLPLPEGRWGLFLADVSGHGTQAAVVMAMLRTLLHAYPGPAQPPEAVLTYLNHHVQQGVPEGMFATAFYGVYEPSCRRLTYACAGHPPPRWRRGRFDVLEVPVNSGLPLGILPDGAWPELELTLRPGDVLLLYTDGIVEGLNTERQPFGWSRLDEALRRGPPRAAALVAHVERYYRDFCNGQVDDDDRTLLAAVAVP